MIERQKGFLVEILGQDGAGALFKSLEKSELVTQALLPRAIFSWVKGVGEFDGFIPGGDVLISFTKSETGFTGNIGDHEFKDESLIHVTAALAVNLGIDKGFNSGTKSADLERLGKSLDLLVRSKLVQEGLTKAELPGGSISAPAHQASADANTGKISHESAAQAHKKAADAHKAAGNLGMANRHGATAMKHREIHDKAPKDMQGRTHKVTAGGWPSGTSSWAKSEDDLEKAGMEPPVKNAAPVAPTAPIAAGQTPAVKPAAPAAVAKAPKLPKIKTGAAKPPGATVALTRSEMNHKCPACADSQFKDDEFVGCICFSALNKSIDMLALDELGCVIHVSEPMDVIVTLLESMGRE